MTQFGYIFFVEERNFCAHSDTDSVTNDRRPMTARSC